MACGEVPGRRSSAMESRLVHEAHGQRTFVAVLSTGDEVMESLKGLAEQERLSAAQITAIGAFSRATLAYFDWERKEYENIAVDEQVEVASLIGDIALDEQGAPALHIHLVLGKRDGGAIAGHLSEAYVRPTLEVILTETPAHLRRVKDSKTGLALIRPNAEAKDRS
jgi:predicted DNA-binding protein with PD1-like motif